MTECYSDDVILHRDCKNGVLAVELSRRRFSLFSAVARAGVVHASPVHNCKL